jgi:hypothetical protein
VAHPAAHDTALHRRGGSPALEHWKRITAGTGDLPPSGTEAWTPRHSFSDWVQGCSLTVNDHPVGTQAYSKPAGDGPDTGRVNQ